MPNGKATGVAYSDPSFESLNVTGATTLDGNVSVGNAAADLVGFYNATAIAQPSGATQGVTGVVSMATLSGAVWGFSSSATFYATVQLVEAMRTTLVNLGLMKGSA